VATIQDVADLAGVSSGTVSHVLNGTARVRPETAARVRRAIAELGYEPNALARSLTTRRSSTLGMAISHISLPFGPELIEHFVPLAAQRGFSVIVATPLQPASLLDECLVLLRRQRVAGILVVGWMGEAALHDLKRQRVPTVLLEPHRLDSGLPMILCDWERGLDQAVARLVGLGHRRIAVVASPLSVGTSVRRVAAFQGALARHGLVCPHPVVAADDFGFTGAREAGRAVLSQRPRPTAVVATTDPIAIGVMRAATDLGLRVPDHVSVVGIDKIALGEFTSPALASLDIPRRPIAEQALAMLLAGIEGEAMPPRVVLPLSLVERESIGPAAPVAEPAGLAREEVRSRA